MSTVQSGLIELDAESIYKDFLHGVRPFIKPNTHIVGVISGGLWLATRVVRDLSITTPVGAISSGLHRDDFSSRGLSDGGQTKLPFEVDGSHILLIDDVLYTGRTIRAVLNELFDFGRPASVQLSVLVDRGSRELPIQCDYAAARLPLGVADNLRLEQDAQGQFKFSLESKSAT
jgi:pyrimidine operon attenuation protein/uracil phosphoribosyltransferase